ncbi:hypothetical protein ACFV1N_46030 [Streptosporangium canum]|uniref:hypothetical protein n=1 Tax=Streptosporangium canum TaxID=324952 RepID=UPI0036B83F50
MSTRGFVGFVSDDTEKIAYNHSDSNPKGLGLEVLEWLRSAVSDAKDPADGITQLRERVRALRVVDSESTPTEEDIARLKEFADQGVSRGKLTEWYVLLRATQGNPGEMLRAGVVEDAASFPLDSQFAEWGYLIDLDAEVFEVYRGFQDKPHERGRFAAREPERDDHWPVALVTSWPLTALPSRDTFLARL